MKFGNVGYLRVQDIMVFDIIQASGWERPIYFAMTVSDDGKIGLRDYMQLRGLAFKFTPRRGPFYMNLDIPMIESHLFTEVEQPSLTPQPGFLWRGLRDSSVYYDEDSRRLVMANYRNLFLTLGENYLQKGDRANGARVLDRMEEVVPRGVIGMDPSLKYRVGMIYGDMGRSALKEVYLREVVADVSKDREVYINQQLTQYNPMIVLYYTYVELKQFDEAQELIGSLKAKYVSDASMTGALQGLEAQLTMARAQATPDTMGNR
jgi:hypothetical protein